MNIKDYVFEIDDDVITIYGECGRITSICDCDSCEKRGFHEPFWISDTGDRRYITIYDALDGFSGFYKIGNYIFNTEFDKVDVVRRITYYEEELNALKKQLKLIEELEKVKNA